MIRTKEDLADWIFDRVCQGQYEGVGNSDSEQMSNGSEVSVSVVGDNGEFKECEVTIDWGIDFCHTFSTNLTYEDVEDAIKGIEI